MDDVRVNEAALVKNGFCTRFNAVPEQFLFAADFFVEDGDVYGRFPAHITDNFIHPLQKKEPGFG